MRDLPTTKTREQILTSHPSPQSQHSWCQSSSEQQLQHFSQFISCFSSSLTSIPLSSLPAITTFMVSELKRPTRKRDSLFHRPCMQLVFKGLLRSCSELRTPPPKTSITEEICNWKFKGLLHTCSELGTPPPKTSITEDIIQLDKRLNIYTKNNTESTPRASKS